MIERYFKRRAKNKAILLGNGDDCALLQSKQVLALSTDTLVAGTHFYTDKISASDLGYRALAVNLSDCAAMGATPLAFLLALTLPAVNDRWLSDFATGLFSLADQFKLDLIGGNTTRGPLAITIQIIGALPDTHALKRSQAKVGDDIYVTGELGEAAYLLKTQDILLPPTPRILFASKLRTLAHAAIDLSDGLSQDLNHILQASNAGAILNLALLPTRRPLEYALAGGEDYELCFSAPLKNRLFIKNLAKTTATPLSRIGKIIAETGLWQIIKGQRQPIEVQGYQHFKSHAL